MSNKLVIHNSLDTFVQNQLSERTRAEYRRDLQHFKTWIKAPLLEVNTRVLVEYRTYLQGRYAPSTVNRMLSTIRSGFEFLFNQGMIAFNPAKAVKLIPNVDNANTKALTDTQASKLLEIASVNQRDLCMLSMLLYLGLRRSELVSIQLGDLQEERDALVLTIRNGKGGKTRRIPIPDSIRSIVDKHLKDYYTRVKVTRKTDFIFRTQRSEKMHPETVRKIVRKYCKKLGIKDISPHSLRATAASNAIDQGCNYIELQYAFGWSSPAMVNRYDKRRGEIKKSAVWRINYNKETK